MRHVNSALVWPPKINFLMTRTGDCSRGNVARDSTRTNRQVGCQEILFVHHLFGSTRRKQTLSASAAYVSGKTAVPKAPWPIFPLTRCTARITKNYGYGGSSGRRQGLEIRLMPRILETEEMLMTKQNNCGWTQQHHCRLGGLAHR